MTSTGEDSQGAVRNEKVGCSIHLSGTKLKSDKPQRFVTSLFEKPDLSDHSHANARNYFVLRAGAAGAANRADDFAG